MQKSEKARNACFVNYYEIGDNVFVVNPRTGRKDRGSIVAICSLLGKPLFYDVLLDCSFRCFCVPEVLEFCE